LPIYGCLNTTNGHLRNLSAKRPRCRSGDLLIFWGVAPPL
jgi:hypothetical protein